jgi:hypothetical protein
MDLDSLEAFALADDRDAVLEQLIPGTEDAYYAHCLHSLHTGDHAAVDEQLKVWTERHGGSSARLREIRNRQALLRWGSDTDLAYDRIQDVLRPNFNHQQEIEGRETHYPTRLDYDSLLRTYRSNAMGYSDLGRFKDRALDGLAGEDLSAEQRRDLLNRLKRPDVKGLVDLILADLDAKRSRGFGSLGIHRLLLREQLDELGRRKPSLLTVEAYVAARLVHLQPGPDDDWQHDPAVRRAYLERIWAFVVDLAPAFNSLKAHVLYHLLQHRRSEGDFDRRLFELYLHLPRQASYVNPDYLKRTENRDVLARVGTDFSSQTLLDTVHDDEPLVRELLARVLLEATGTEGFETLVRMSFLRRVRAEAKILAGVGDMETWYSELDDPSYYQQLKERVDIEFAPTNKSFFRGDEAVTLAVDVKNVKTLVLKVFAINTFGYFLANRREIDTTIDLDGLVAGDEQTHAYSEPPLRRVRRDFEFPSLSAPGVYVVELIGGGRSSRALIRKGSLRTLERVGAAGHVFTILDENSQPARDATLWLRGREYTPDGDGDIVVPFSTSPRREKILLRRGSLTTVESFQHLSENYTFSAGIYCDRESLLKGKKAQVLLRPLLRLEDRPVSLKLLEDATLVIESTDRFGISTTKEVNDIEVVADRETVYTFQVPDDLATISFTLRGRVEVISTSEKLDVSSTRSYSLNGIDAGAHVQALHLARTSDGYVVYALGKTGEPRRSAPITITFEHEDYTDRYAVTLQTDDRARVELGELTGMLSLTAQGPNGVTETWALHRDGCRRAESVHGQALETLRVPYLGQRAKVAPEAFSLLERRGAGYLADRFGALALQDGYLELRGLPAGDFDLLLKESGESLQIRLAPGEERGSWVAAPLRLLERGNPRPLHVTQAAYDKGGLSIHVAGNTPLTRVHVFATRFAPPQSASQELGPLSPWSPQSSQAARDESHYVSGRDIGDEYRYILERRFASRHPGNMLSRPGLLLNPWAVRKTDTGLNVAGGGGNYDKKSSKEKMAKKRPSRQDAAYGQARAGSANLDFLGQEAVVVPNLSPDSEGMIRIPAEVLEGANQVRVVAVDPLHTVWREVALAETDKGHEDLRLILGLDPDGHFTERNQVTLVPGAGELKIADITTSKLEVYDTLAKVYALYATLSGDETLDTFSFVLRWPTLEREEKCRLYSEHACHELHAFIARKDPEFFEDVVRPYLANKRHKTFMDRYLLGSDLSAYAEPWAHGRLNVVERILLGGRIPDGQPRAKRHVNDLQGLVRRNVEHDTELFRTALQSSALEADDALGFAQAAKDQLSAMSSKMDLGGASPFGAAQGAAPPRMASRKRSKSRSMAPPPMPAPAMSAPSEDFMEFEEAACEIESACLDDDLDFGDDEGEREERDFEARKQVRSFYRSPETTQELAENDYYKLTVDEQGPELVTVNAFWRDFAVHEAGPFVSTNLPRASRNFTEMMLALSVLDLPFDAEAPETAFEGAVMSLKARASSVVFHKEIKPAPEASEQVPILVSQNYFRADDRYRHNEDGEQLDNYIRGEFLVHVVYRCQVVLTNPTSSPHKLDLLLQIPRGAIPVENGFQTRGQHLHLGSYATQSIEYGFYFPATGEFPHYPVHVSKNEELIAFAAPTPLKVVLQPSEIDRTSWAYVSQRASSDEVLSYLRENNVERLDLSRIAWRVKDHGFFESVIALLRSRRVFDETLWSYSLKHRDTENLAEYLKFEGSFIDDAGLALSCGLLEIDPIARRRYQHLEYAPLVNARAHRLGGKLKILNNRLEEQYRRTIRLLSYRPELSHSDRLAVSYYLLLQDRIEEGLLAFGRVDSEQVDTTLQYDYMRAYAAFYSDEPEAARAIAEPYVEYPVDRWRKLFRNVLAQLDEAKGSVSRVVDPGDRAQRQDELAATEVSLELSVEAGAVTVRSRNLESVTVNLYAMDIELLFSRKPFVQQQSGQPGFIAPNWTQELALGGDETTFELPDVYRKANVIVELVSAGLRRSEAHYAHQLSVSLIEGYGQVNVAHKATGKPLAKTYVKAYARFGGSDVRFFKDGYTDLRGRFDYASLSTDELGGVERFALLVMSDEHGAVIREATPPKQ